FTDLDDFAIAGLEGTTSEPQGVTVEGGAGEIRLSGVIRVGGCSHFDARLRREGRTLTLRVVGRPAGACPAIPVSYPYTARVDGLSPGSYRLLVVYGHSPRYQVVFDDVVEVSR